MKPELRKALDTLRAWAEAGNAVALHILACKECDDERDHYCAECEVLWRHEMAVEANVISILPVLRDAGFNVDSYVGQVVFRRFALRTAHRTKIQSERRRQA